MDIKEGIRAVNFLLSGEYRKDCSCEDCKTAPQKVQTLIDYCSEPKDTETKFDPQSMDAKVWAKEFMRLYRKNYNWEIDEGLMIGWFANAIMAGYDEAKRRTKPTMAEYSKKMDKLIKKYKNIPIHECMIKLLEEAARYRIVDAKTRSSSKRSKTTTKRV